MRIVRGNPPNFAAISDRFRLQRFAGQVFFFAYGDVIYTQAPDRLTSALIAHEEVHGSRQRLLFGGAEEWWTRYLEDDGFRLEEEKLAHIAELGWHRQNASRAERRRAEHSIVSKLSHAVYGPMCSRGQAKELLGL